MAWGLTETHPRRHADCWSSVQKEATMDLFLAYAYHDEEYASGLEDSLAGRGLVVGEPLSLWPGQRLLPQIDLRLHESRAAIVIVSRAGSRRAGRSSRSSRMSAKKTWRAIRPGSPSRHSPGRTPSGWSTSSVRGNRPSR